MPSATEVYRFDGFVLDVGERELSSGAGRVVLAPKAFDLLVALVRADRLVTKEELLTRVWPEASVEEGIIAVHISALRKALGDTHRSPRFIETVAGTTLIATSPPDVTGPRTQSTRTETAPVASVPTTSTSTSTAPDGKGAGNPGRRRSARPPRFLRGGRFIALR